MTPKPEDICPRPPKLPPPATEPLVAPLYLASVYECRDPAQADAVLGGTQPGYAYSRDGNPNRDVLGEQCRRLHGAEKAAITATGMGAMALAVLSQLSQGDHVVASTHLYGRSLRLFGEETARLGISSTFVDTCDLAATAAACTDRTRMIVVETITNPVLRVSDLTALAKLAHDRGALLLVDNTFASPSICRPFELGADLVLESLTKIMNGHSDVVLGLLCGPERLWSRVPSALSTWGLPAAPFDCWLAARGLQTMHLRVERASANALAVAQYLTTREEIARVDYPGLPSHVDHQLAVRQFGQQVGFGSMVSFDLRGGLPAVEKLIRAAEKIPFCPSLGEVSTTLSHPQSTSHRSLSPDGLAQLGISAGTIRLSVGVESAEFIIEAIEEGLRG